MILPLAVTYLVAGIVAAIITMLVFPPEKGHRPSIPLQLGAATIFVAFWPMLAAMCVWYYYRTYLLVQFEREAESTIDYSVQRTFHAVKPK